LAYLSINESFEITKRVFYSNLYSHEGINQTVSLSGPTGIGKSSLGKKLANHTNSHFFVVDATVLKEGEITGMPLLKKNINGEEKLEYAPHYIIDSIQTMEDDIIKNIDNNIDLVKDILEIDNLNTGYG